MLSRPSGMGDPSLEQLLSLVRGISPKILTQTLRALERDGLVKREIFPEIPPRMEYSLTEPGKELVDPIASIRDWAVAHMERVITAREMYDVSSGASIPADTRTQ